MRWGRGMNAITNASADRRAWLKKRLLTIGGSDLSAIMGLNPYCSPWEVWAEKTERLEPFEGNAATRAGQLYERALLDYAESQVGEIERDVWLPADDVPLSATCDGIVGYGTPYRRPVECKTTGIVGPVCGDWGDEYTDEVPEGYAVQCHAQLICTGADLCYLFALVAGRGTLQYEIERNESVVDAIKTYVQTWWDRHVVGDMPPPVEGTRLDAVKRLRKQPAKTIEIPSFAMVEKWQQLRQDRLDAEKAEQAAQVELLASIGDAEAATLPDGRCLTYLETTRNEKPRPARTITYRTLRIKK